MLSMSLRWFRCFNKWTCVYRGSPWFNAIDSKYDLKIHTVMFSIMNSASYLLHIFMAEFSSLSQCKTEWLKHKAASRQAEPHSIRINNTQDSTTNRGKMEIKRHHRRHNWKVCCIHYREGSEAAWINLQHMFFEPWKNTSCWETFEVL